MTGILGNFLKPENMDRLALGFNQLRMRPDAGLAASIQNRQALRQQQMGRDAAMEFFQGKPGADAYIAALGAGGDGPGLIQSYITAQNAAARNNVGKVDRNRSIEILRQREAKGDKEAGRIADMIEAGGNAAQLLGIYYQGDVSGKAVQNTKEFGRGLSKVTLKNNTVKYYNNNVEITDPVAIGEAIAAEKAFDNEQAGAKKRAEAEGTGAGKNTVKLRETIEGLAALVQKSERLIGLMYNHGGMAGATGQYGRVTDLGLLPGTPEGNSPREFATLHNQLAGTIFLSAFEKLKGGGQITEIEGEKATQAASNVDRLLRPVEYREALINFLQSLKDLQQQKMDELSRNSTQDLPPITPMPTFEPDL
jgi:hypothetical protein